MSDSIIPTQPPQDHWCSSVLRTPVFALRPPGRAHAAIALSAPLPTKARSLLMGLLLGGLLLVYWNVVNSSVQRGEQLKRQMADTAQRCDTSATRRRATTCNTPADADALRGGPVGPKRLAAR